MRKPDFCLCENKDADQLCSNCTADQRLCFRNSASAISLLPKSEISSFYPSCETLQACLCRTRSATPKKGFLMSRLIIMPFSCRIETEGTQLPCKAVVNLSDLRIPLMWKDSDHFKNKGGETRNLSGILRKNRFLPKRKQRRRSAVQ